MAQPDLVTPYREYFKLIAATTDALRDQVFALRYEVYCKELGWEDPNPEERESDDFDQHSIHCLLYHKHSESYAGTVRLVETQPDSPDPCLPLLTHYDSALFNSDKSPLKMPKGRFGEISRLAVYEQFRRRPGEQDTPDGSGPEAELFQWTQDDRRRFPHIALGLYLAAATVGLSEGMDGVYAMMEPRLARHLHYGGIFFEQVGQAVEFRGARAPFYISRQMLFDHLSPPLRDLLDAIAEDLCVQMSPIS